MRKSHSVVLLAAQSNIDLPLSQHLVPFEDINRLRLSNPGPALKYGQRSNIDRQHRNPLGDSQRVFCLRFSSHSVVQLGTNTKPCSIPQGLPDAYTHSFLTTPSTPQSSIPRIDPIVRRWLPCIRPALGSHWFTMIACPKRPGGANSGNDSVTNLSRLSNPAISILLRRNYPKQASGCAFLISISTEDDRSNSHDRLFGCYTS